MSTETMFASIEAESSVSAFLAYVKEFGKSIDWGKFWNLIHSSGFNEDELFCDYWVDEDGSVQCNV